MRVLVIHSYAYQVGGTVTFLKYLVKYLDRAKFEPIILFLSQGELVSEFQTRGVKVKVINSGKLSNVILTTITIFRILWLIYKERIDIVFSNDCRGHIYGGTAAYFARIPATFFWHGFFAPLPLIRIALFVPCSAILTNSKEVKQAIDLYSNSRKKTSFVSLGVELPNVSDRSELRSKLGLEDNIPIISQVSGFMPFKGNKYFIEAAREVVKKIPKAKFLVVGNAPFREFEPYKKEIEDLVKRFNLESNIIFMGHRDDVLEIMSVSDMVVHPIIAPEPFGLVILEAMACTTPVIASNIGGPAGIIEDGVEGILVPPRDSTAIAGAILRLLNDKEFGSRMGKNGRKKVEKYFQANKMVKEIERIWEKLPRHLKE